MNHCSKKIPCNLDCYKIKLVIKELTQKDNSRNYNHGTGSLLCFEFIWEFIERCLYELTNGIYKERKRT